MKTLKVIGMVPLVLLAATAFSQGDDRAVPRGGGGGGSSAGAGHAGGGSSQSSGSQGGGSSQGASAASQGGSSGSAYFPEAAGRRPRPGTGTGNRDRYGNDYGRSGYGGYYGGYYGYPYYYYNPYAYWGYGDPSYGWGLGYGYGYGYGNYYSYYPGRAYGGGYAYRDGGAAQIRTLVDPPKARVYVDGYYAGIADDFDGMLQRLNVSPGRHDITFKLEGYTSHTFFVYANGGETLKLRVDLVKGTGETKESIGEEYERRPSPARESGSERERAETSRPEAVRPEPGREVDSESNDRPQVRMPQAGRGEVLFDILPPDASVYIDGEFHGKASQLSQVQLPYGRHRVEVVRPGYRTEETEINVDPEARKVVVRLDRR